MYALNTALRGGPRTKIPNFRKLLGAMLALFFALERSWALLGRSWRFLLRLLSLLAGFFASWNAPGSILEGFGEVQAWFSRLQGLIF